jgi:uncharacterized membrane protein YqjE
MAHAVTPAERSRTVPSGSPGQDDQTLGALVASASRDLGVLVHNEVELAKAELRQEVKTAAKGGVMFGAAAFVGLLGVILLSVALAYVLVALGLPVWAGFLIVAVVYFLIAGVCALIGKKKVQQVGKPERTIRTSKDTAQFLKSPRGA